MFSDDRVQNRCRSHNAAVREVTIRRRWDADELLDEVDRSLLVSGGEKRVRNRLMCEEVARTSLYSGKPCVVFSGDGGVEEELIRRAERGETGELYICGGSYPEYDFFCGMDPSAAARFIAHTAELCGSRDSARLHGYASAFLRVLKATAGRPPSFSDITEFARENSDTAVAAQARSLGLTTEYDALSDPLGGGEMRTVLVSLEYAFSSLRTPSCRTRFSLTSALSPPSKALASPCVILIKPRTPSPDILGAYFAAVFSSLCADSFAFFIDDVSLLGCDEFASTLGRMKERGQAVVSFFTENACLYRNDELRAHFSRHIIFPDGSADSADLQALLDTFGTYTAFDVGEGTQKPAHFLFSLERSPQKNTVTYSRPKLLAEEAFGYDAVVKGHNMAEICLVGKFG